MITETATKAKANKVLLNIEIKILFAVGVEVK